MTQEQMPHRLELDGRSHLTVTGVTEVVSFEEAQVILQTAMGTLTVRGDGLQLKSLSLEGGQVEVDGTVDSMSYEESRPSGGWFSRLLG